MATKDSDPSKWVCPPHTKAKHDMLGYYLDGWYPILSTWNGRIMFFDGFAGRGRYDDGSEGSPQVALRHLIRHRSFPQMSDKEFIFAFVEANSDNAASLSEELDKFKSENQPWPPNVKTYVVNEKFDVTATGIIENLRERKRRLAPTFAFIDPFGYSGLPLDVIADFLDHPKTEVFINFMVGHVQRFIEREGQENAIRKLFGMEPSDVLKDLNDGGDRIQYLRSVYERQLQERAGFDFVQSFAMINDTGNITYYLIHGTRHIKGVEVMKDAMWKVDPGGGNTFSDRLAGQDVLFVPEPDLRPLAQALQQQFTSRTGLGAKEIVDYALVHTPYKTSHVRPALKSLERDGAIEVTRPKGPRQQFAEGVTIRFP